MSATIAIPEFNDRQVQERLIHCDSTLSGLGSVRVRDHWDFDCQIDLSQHINKFLLYSIFLPSIMNTVVHIRHLENMKSKYYIDFSHRDPIHPSFIRHYAETLAQCYGLPTKTINIHWRNYTSTLATRKVDLEKLTWTK